MKRTYQFLVIPQNSQVQFLFEDEKDYGALTQITLPNWEGCDGRFKRGAFTDCTRKRLQYYINEEVQIPQLALDSLIEGRVRYQFVIDEQGMVSNGKITQNIGGGLAEELEKTLLALPPLEPAQINEDNKVATEITLEVYCDIVLR